MTIHLGDVPASSTLYIPFTTYDANGASVTLTGLAATDIEIYKNGSVTKRSSDAGYTLLDTDGIDFDGITGLHGFSIDLSDNTDAGFYAVGSFYWVVVSSVTVSSQTVNLVAATFRIREAETTTGRIEARVASIANDAVTAAAIADNAIDAGAIASNAITSAKIADGFLTTAKLGSGFFDGVWSVATRLLTAGTNIVLAKGTGVTGFNDLSSTQVGDACWDEVVDGSTTARESVRLANSANGGKASGMETTNPLIRDLADTKTRINSTVDADGNRSAVTLDLT